MDLWLSNVCQVSWGCSYDYTLLTTAARLFIVVPDAGTHFSCPLSWVLFPDHFIKYAIKTDKFIRFWSRCTTSNYFTKVSLISRFTLLVLCEEKHTCSWTSPPILLLRLRNWPKEPCSTLSKANTLAARDSSATKASLCPTLFARTLSMLHIHSVSWCF